MVVGGACGTSGDGISIQSTGGTCPGTAAVGSIEVSFATPTYVATASLSGQCNVITLTLEGGVTETVNVNNLDTANGGIWIYKDKVVKLTVGCTGPGVLKAVKYMFCPIDSCPIFHLDFSELVSGQYISDEWKQTKGVVITARKNTGSSAKGFTPSRSSNYSTHVSSGGGARVFDTAIPIEDPDLGSPNQDFGGPGKGCGGGKYLQRSGTCQSFAGGNGIPACNPGCAYTKSDHSTLATASSQLTLNPWVNNVPHGNVIIIQENANQANPDDTANGGWIEFFFDPPASVEKLQILDIDEGTTPKVTLSYANGGPDTSFSFPATGDDGFAEVPVFAKSVTKLSIFYTGSGCVSEVHYGICPPSPTPAAMRWKSGDAPLH